MDDFSTNWLKEFRENLPLPPPSTSDLSGWVVTLEKLQDVDFSKEFDAPDSATTGIRAYVSIFNKETGQFHGKTWTSPVITNLASGFINFSIHGILPGNSNMIVIEFASRIQYLGGEVQETSLFFTAFFPFSTPQHICPLFIGTPRFLLQNPDDYGKYCISRQGQLIVRLQQNDDLLKGKFYMPLCTFMSRPPPGIKSFQPLQMEPSFPLVLTDITLHNTEDLHAHIQNEFVKHFSQKYDTNPEFLMLHILRYTAHIVAHNGYTNIHEVYKADLPTTNNWKFDSQIPIPRYVDSPKFALLIQIVVSIEFNTDFLYNPLELPQSSRKKIVEIPLGFAVFHPDDDLPVTLKLCQTARFSPFGVRQFNPSTELPTISFNVSYSPINDIDKNITSLPIDFQTLVGSDGGTLNVIDISQINEEPQIGKELKDPMNKNHVRILIQYIIPRPGFAERFPPDIFRKLGFKCEAWHNGVVKSEPITLQPLQGKFLAVQQLNLHDGKRGTILALDFLIETEEHLASYFLLMNANELQVDLIDTESGMLMASFNVCTSLIIRQGRQSVQFNSHADLLCPDGEIVGSIHYVAGAYGTIEGKIIESEFGLLNQVKNQRRIVAKSLKETDPEFREKLMKSDANSYELAIKHRDGRRKKLIISDLQRRFLRYRNIYPVPGIDTRFVFESAFIPEEDTTVTVSIDDDNLRLVGLVNGASEDIRLGGIEGRLKPIRINCPFKPLEADPVSKLSLVQYPSDKVLITAGEAPHFEFAFFTMSNIDKMREATVTFTNSNGDLLDLFKLHIHPTGPVVHETVNIFQVKGGMLTKTLYTVNHIDNTISSSTAVSAVSTDFGIKLSSGPIDVNMKAFLFMFGTSGILIKVIRLNVIIVKSDIISAGGTLKLILNTLIGKKICCRSNDNRVARFTSHDTMTELKKPGALHITAHAAGSTLLYIMDCEQRKLNYALINVGEGDNDFRLKRRLIEKIIETLPANKVQKRQVTYTNSTARTQNITLTTNQPQIVDFEPKYYEVRPGDKAKLRFIFYKHEKMQNVFADVYVNERKEAGGPVGCYKLILTYE